MSPADVWRMAGLAAQEPEPQDEPQARPVAYVVPRRERGGLFLEDASGAQLPGGPWRTIAGARSAARARGFEPY